MTETVLGFDLTVICANADRYEKVELKIIDDTVLFVTADGTELKEDSAVTFIDSGKLLAPPDSIAYAIIKYRGQK